MADKNLTVLHPDQASSISASASPLREALAERTELVLGDTSEPSEYGADLRPAAWMPPDTITPDMIEEAKHQYAKLSAMMAPVNPDSMKRWLVTLGLLTGGNMGEDVAEATIAGMMAVYRNAPAGAFTNASMQRLLSRTEFFPKGGKVFATWLDDERGRLNRQAEKLGAILTAGVREAPPKWSKEAAEANRQRIWEKQHRERQELAQAIKEREASAIVGGGLKPLRLVTPTINAKAQKMTAE